MQELSRGRRQDRVWNGESPETRAAWTRNGGKAEARRATGSEKGARWPQRAHGRAQLDTGGEAGDWRGYAKRQELRAPVLGALDQTGAGFLYGKPQVSTGYQHLSC